jgi:Uma2 family endonuclease
MSTLARPSAPAATPLPTPPLQSGDRLTADEFERRYDAMPDVKKAELIEGVVFMPSPVTHRFHGNPHFNVIGWLFHYAAFTPGVEGGDNSTLRLALDSDPQPDAYLIILPSHGGQVRIDADGYIVGAPELIAEVAASSASIDLNAKLNAYRQNGVREYVVWRVYEAAIDWFVLRDGAFVPQPIGADGLYRSEILPGLWLDPAALMRGDLPAVLQRVQQGTASPEHAAFVTRLQAAAAGS